MWIQAWAGQALANKMSIVSTFVNMVYRAKGQTMEDKLTWTDTVSAYALHEAGIHPLIMRIWGHLRTAVVYFMRYQPGQHTDHHINAAQDELLAYARLVQETWNMHELMTLNLHTCLVHVPEQARKCGPAAYAGELWVERLMGDFKRHVKYRCTRYPETTAVQHWLLGQALDDCLLADPSVSSVLDSIRVGRPTSGEHYDNQPGPCSLIGKLQTESLTSSVRTEVYEALRSTEQVNLRDPDGRAVTSELSSEDVLACDNTAEAVPGAGRKPLVQLQSSNTASIQGRASLVRTHKSWLSKVDCHALVPYSLEEPTAATQVALAARSVADAVAAARQALPDAGNLRQEQAAAAAARVNQRTTVCGLASADADRSAGFNCAAQQAGQDAEGACAAAEEVMTLLRNQREDASLATQPATALLDALEATAAAITTCRAAIADMPASYQEPPDPAPPSLCTVLKVERLLLWTQVKDGEQTTRKLAIGTMTLLEPVGEPAEGYEHTYCDGSLGRRKCFPTMLVPKRGRHAASYKYAVWLDQIECAMVTAQRAGPNGTCRTFYLPVNKSSRLG